jgi:hypothetical protein
VKVSLKCPKCQHDEVWHVPYVKEYAGLSGRTPLAMDVEEGMLRSEWLGPFEAYACARCGFVEWYATRVEQLRENAKTGLRLLKRPVEGPYR